MNIFISFTPYHILLSYSIALSEEASKENYLFVISDSKQVNNLVKLFESTNPLAFRKIITLRGVYGVSSKLKRKKIVKSNANYIEEFVKKNRNITKVYVFHDGRIESQAALYFATKYSKNCTGIYVEDGSGAYSAYKQNKKSFYRILLGKIFYGIWWSDITVLGSSKYIKEVKAIFPPYLRSEINAKQRSAITKEPLMNLRNQTAFQNYLQSMGLNGDEYSLIDAVLVIAHSELVDNNSAYKESILEIVNKLNDEGFHIGIKYHPRETKKDFLLLKNRENIHIFPQSIPMELIYIWKQDQIKLVIGDISTSVLTAKWLLNKVNVFSISPIVGLYDDHLYKTFSSLGIVLVDNLVDLSFGRDVQQDNILHH